MTEGNTRQPPHRRWRACRRTQRSARQRALAIVIVHVLAPPVGDVEAVCVMLATAGAESSR